MEQSGRGRCKINTLLRHKGKARSVNIRRTKQLDRRSVPLTPADTPVATDVFLHNLPPVTLEALRVAVEQGLTPSGLDFTGDVDPIVILRLTRSRAREARLMPTLGTSKIL